MKDTYEAALKRAKEKGVGQCDDAALMAHICKYNIPMLVGAVAPKLVWEGAQTKGLKTKELLEMARRDIMEVDDLQWL
jgi:hypothetical protein